MGHSTQVVGERTETFRDSDLLLLVGLMTREIESDAEPYGAVKPAVDAWFESCRHRYAPGIISIDDEISSFGDTERAEFRALLDAIQRQLKRFDEFIPADVANSFIRVSGVRFYDYKRSYLLDSIGKLRRLAAAQTSVRD